MSNKMNSGKFRCFKTIEYYYIGFVKFSNQFILIMHENLMYPVE